MNYKKWLFLVRVVMVILFIITRDLYGASVWCSSALAWYVADENSD